MESRLECVRAYINNIFDKIENPDDKRAAYIHSYGVSQCCAFLAANRSLDLELSTAIGLLHDVYSYKTGFTVLHSHNGAEMIRVAFKYDLKDLFTEDEQNIIKSAIYHHSDKEHVHDGFDELLKDGDILQHVSFDSAFSWVYGIRLLNITKELRMNIPKTAILAKGTPVIKLFNQSSVADIAQSLAERKIVGEKSDTDYMKLIRYFPEETAFDELKNNWCAAFVYHCCIESGLELPIRVPHTAKKTANCRFAGVGAWYEWGVDKGFCHFEKDGYIPKRGDILIYNNIIPKEDKPCRTENTAWHDHIGIVLSCSGDSLTVAEGNADNKNVSDILSRKRDKTIGCYIRIPEDYSYDGWKTDFKSGRTRIVDYPGI